MVDFTARKRFISVISKAISFLFFFSISVSMHARLIEYVKNMHCKSNDRHDRFLNLLNNLKALSLITLFIYFLSLPDDVRRSHSLRMKRLFSESFGELFAFYA